MGTTSLKSMDLQFVLLKISDSSAGEAVVARLPVIQVPPFM